MRRMILAVHLACTENLKERDHLRSLDIDGRIEFKWILKKQVATMYKGFSWLRMGASSRIL